jgi:hypothetical protein
VAKLPEGKEQLLVEEIMVIPLLKALPFKPHIFYLF